MWCGFIESNVEAETLGGLKLGYTLKRGFERAPDRQALERLSCWRHGLYNFTPIRSEAAGQRI